MKLYKNMKPVKRIERIIKKRAAAEACCYMTNMNPVGKELLKEYTEQQVVETVFRSLVRESSLDNYKLMSRLISKISTKG